MLSGGPVQGLLPGKPMSDLLATVGTYSFPAEAHIARTKLEAEGIYAVVQDEYTIGMNWLYSGALGGVKVLVPEPELARARRILGEAEPDAAASSRAPWGRCPKCGEAEIKYQAQGRLGTLLTYLLLGLPLLFPKRELCCRSCGFCWPMPA